MRVGLTLKSLASTLRPPMHFVPKHAAVSKVEVSLVQDFIDTYTRLFVITGKAHVFCAILSY
jgi:hypothetical protein